MTLYKFAQSTPLIGKVIIREFATCSTLWSGSINSAMGEELWMALQDDLKEFKRWYVVEVSASIEYHHYLDWEGHSVRYPAVIVGIAKH